jgi:hypothetical protein
MTGDFLDAIARRVVSPASHRVVVLPALADLQYEVRTRHVHHALRAYAGAWNAILASLLHDAGVAVQRPGFVDAATTVAVLVGMQGVYYGGMLSLTLTQVSRVRPAAIVQLTVLAVIASVVPVAALLLASRDSRHAAAPTEQNERG